MVADETHDDDVFEIGDVRLAHLSLTHESAAMAFNIEYNGLFANFILV